MKSLFHEPHRGDLVRRLRALRPEDPRRWGRMSAHQAVVHLSDTFRAMLGDRPLPAKPVGPKRLLMRFAAFTLPVPWPQGVPTSPEIDAEKRGTPPGDFAADVAELERLVSRFAATEGRGLAPHWAWGAMTRGEWGRYGYRHVDHHLRQFGA